jgi:hypothetical protein
MQKCSCIMNFYLTLPFVKWFSEGSNLVCSAEKNYFCLSLLKNESIGENSIWSILCGHCCHYWLCSFPATSRQVQELASIAHAMIYIFCTFIGFTFIRENLHEGITKDLERQQNSLSTVENKNIGLQNDRHL